MSGNKNLDYKYSYDDEVNLIDLVRFLWRGKVIIITSTVIFMICAILYAVFVQQWWTSTAVITKGQYQDTAELREKITNLYAVANDPLALKNLDDFFDESNFLEQYVLEFNAFTNKKKFIDNNDLIKDYWAKNDISSNGQKLIFVNQWAKNISAELDSKKEKDRYKLKFQAISSNLSHDLLVSYSTFIASQVRSEVINGLRAKIEHNVQLLKAKKLALEESAKSKIYLETLITGYAFDIASTAKADKPMSNMSNNQLFPIDIGANGLKEKEKILRNIKDLSIFEPELSDVKIDLSLLEGVKIDSDVIFNPIRFLKNADYPIIRDKPKRTLIVLVATLFGFIFGVLVVALLNIFRKKDSNIN
ncbi:Wzz/FepE/Etk N-terminal domain-containing protein [Photobacterium kishitanii]|uniref:Wzz/FepE/Etk N-terminal domain-containing protein n=1 Tax=Photobacterium kishitanii TaxID=318456 RepID=UPI0015E68301|nr:Wzz/FepE/Etk N-terminal domain-containing protein [Photobacterium kishitanii]